MSFLKSLWRSLIGDSQTPIQPIVGNTKQASQDLAKSIIEKYLKSTPYRICCTDESVEIEFLDKKGLDSKILWEDILCVAVETTGNSAGIHLALRSPPYNKHLPIGCEGAQPLIEKVKERKFLQELPAVAKASERFLQEKLQDDIRSSFSSEEYDLVKQLLQECNATDERVPLAVVKLSEGDLEKLRKLVNLANNDFRDILTAAW